MSAFAGADAGYVEQFPWGTALTLAARSRLPQPGVQTEDPRQAARSCSQIPEAGTGVLRALKLFHISATNLRKLKMRAGGIA